MALISGGAATKRIIATALLATATALPCGKLALGQPQAAAAEATALDEDTDSSATPKSSELADAAQATETRLALARQQSGENSLPFAAALRDHARSLTALGQFAEAEKLVRKALVIFSGASGADSAQAMMAQSQLGLILTREGRYADAEPLLRAASRPLALRTSPESAPTLTCEINLATDLIGQSRFHDAQTLLHHVVAVRGKTAGSRDPALLNAKLQLGRVLRAEGSLARAEATFRNVVEARRATLGDDHTLTLGAIVELADVLVAERRAAQAEPLYRLALDKRTSSLGERHPGTLQVAGYLARDLALLGRFDEAEQLARHTVQIQTEVIGETHPDTLASMNTLAFVLRERGRPEAAEPVLRHVLDLRMRTLGPDSTGTLSTMAALALDVAAQGRRPEAEHLLAQVIDGRRKERRAGRAALDTALIQLGFVRLGDPDQSPQALDPLREAVTVLRERRADASFSPRSDIEMGRETVSQAGTYRLLADADWAAAQARPSDLASLREEAFLALQDAMSGTVTQSFALAAARSAAREAGAEIGDLAEQWQQLVDRWRAVVDHELETMSLSAPNDTAPGTDLAALSRNIAGIDAQLRAKAPGYFALTRPEAVPLAKAQALLGPDEAVLIVTPSVFGTHVMVLRHDALAWQRSKLTRREIIGIVRNLRQELDPDAIARTNRAFSRQLAFRLYRELILPLETDLKGAKQVFVAADGALASLPFEVLVATAPTGSNDDPVAMRATNWFGDAYALTQLPSLQTLEFLRSKPRASRAEVQTFEGFGDPSLKGAAVARGSGQATGGALASVAELSSLPGTADELRRIATALKAPATSIHLGNADTKSAIEAMDLSKARVLAFATHGLLAGQLLGEDEAGLVFTPPEMPSADDNGYLSTSDITRLKLNADLVVLSACNSGAGGGENTPPLSGLARAFFYAGARDLLVSHWPVYDDVAPRITVELIAAHHANPKLSLAEALQTATRKIRNDKDDPSLAFPSAWAPFVLVGDWRP